MSFFNDSSVCQSVANPINKILDVSTKSDIGNFRTENIVQDSSNIHQYRKLDNTLQNEFYKFVESPHNNPHTFIFPQEITRERIPDSIQMGLETISSSQHDWTKDFMNLDLRDNHERQLYQTNQTQVLNQNGSKFDTFHSQRHPPLRSMTHMSSIQSNLRSSGDLEFSEHENTHVHLAELDNQFDAAFTEVEQELVIDTQKAEDEETDQHSSAEGLGTTGRVELENKFEDEDKTKFANLARSVFDIMNNTPKGVSLNTTNKFKQSGFMQLMNKISMREIEISNDKKKFVDQDGIDIRTNIDDPLHQLGADDEPLQSPFEAAMKVSPNVNSNAWQGDFI